MDCDVDALLAMMWLDGLCASQCCTVKISHNHMVVWLVFFLMPWSAQGFLAVGFCFYIFYFVKVSIITFFLNYFSCFILTPAISDF